MKKNLLALLHGLSMYVFLYLPVCLSAHSVCPSVCLSYGCVCVSVRQTSHNGAPSLCLGGSTWRPGGDRLPGRLPAAGSLAVARPAGRHGHRQVQRHRAGQGDDECAGPVPGPARRVLHLRRLHAPAEAVRRARLRQHTDDVPRPGGPSPVRLRRPVRLAGEQWGGRGQEVSHSVRGLGHRGHGWGRLLTWQYISVNCWHGCEYLLTWLDISVNGWHGRGYLVECGSSRLESTTFLWVV